MNTHDEEKVKYFRGNGVNVVKTTLSNGENGPFADINDSLMFTHHQKTAITSLYDSSAGKSRILPFLGALDLTDSRYDNPSHSLFRTLQTIHAPTDFWQACALEKRA